MAEVKVRVTAQNETRTGLQQALSDAKQFGQEATRSVTIDEQAAMAPIRKMQSALAEASKVSGPQLSDQQAVKVALEATGLQQLEDLKAALAEVDNKVLQVALEATGLDTIEELRAALDQAEDKTISLALEATGLSSVQELRSALDQAENKTVELALEATGLSSVEELQAAIDAVESKNIEIAADNERALAPLREIQAKLREIREQAGQPIDLPAASAPVGGIQLTASESRRASTAIRGLAADLSNATSPGQAFEAVLARLAQTAGRLTSLVVGFAVGKIIAAQFDKLNTAFEQAISNAAKFSAAFQSLSKATNFDSAISSFKQLNSIADQTAETLKRLQSDRGARLANIAAGGGFTRGGPFERLRELEQAQRAAAAAQLVNDSEFLLGQSGKRLGIAGDSGAEQQFDRRAKQEQELFALEQALQAARKDGNGQVITSLKAAIELTKQRLEIDDQIVQKQKEAATAAEAMAARQQAAGTSRAIADFGVDPATLLARAQERLSALENPNITANMGLTPEQAAAERKRIMLEILGLEQQVTSEIEKQKADRERAAKSLADALEDREFAGLSPAEQQAKIEADQAALISGIESGEISSTEAAQRAAELARRQDALGAGGITGSAGASSLQRIGFASNEFFDTRNKKDPAEAIQAGNKILQDIKRALESGQPLVLSSNS